jgi:hypothetical protein
MDSTFIVIMIGFLVIILVVYFYASSGLDKFEDPNLVFKGAENDDREQVFPALPEGSFRVILFVAYKEEPIGPIRITLTQDSRPGELLTNKMDDELNIPMQSRTELRRRLYWTEGAKFLDETETMAEQGVNPGNMLVLTDQDDPNALKELVDALVNMESLQRYGDISS